MQSGGSKCNFLASFLNNWREESGTGLASQVPIFCSPNTGPAGLALLGLPRTHPQQNALFLQGWPCASQAEKRQSHVKIGIIQRRTFHQDHRLLKEHCSFLVGSVPWYLAMVCTTNEVDFCPIPSTAKTLQNFSLPFPLRTKPKADSLAISNLFFHRVQP